jgi:hypothetical protein
MLQNTTADSRHLVLQAQGSQLSQLRTVHTGTGDWWHLQRYAPKFPGAPLCCSGLSVACPFAAAPQAGFERSKTDGRSREVNQMDTREKLNRWKGLLAASRSTLLAGTALTYSEKYDKVLLRRAAQEAGRTPLNWLLFSSLSQPNKQPG